MLTRRLALAFAFAFVASVRAEDPPRPASPPPDGTKPDDAKPPADPPRSAAGTGVLNPNANKPQLHPAGQVVLKVSKVDGSTITTKVPEMERNTNNGGRRKSGGQLHRVEKDKDYDLASDVKVRWHALPKKPDGKSYSDKEYKALLDPPGTPGYKADMSDLKTGQTVRLYLSKGSAKDDKVIATVVMILTDAPKAPTSRIRTSRRRRSRNSPADSTVTRRRRWAR